MKTDLFQSWGQGWVFQIFWHIQWSTFTISSFKICNTSSGIPSPPLALFWAMLPKAHLPSYSRMSGSRWVWVIKPSWLYGSWWSFLYSSYLYSCHLLIYSASLRSIQLMFLTEPIFAWNVPLVSLNFCIVHWGRLSYPSLIFFWNSAFKWVYLSLSPLLFVSLLFTAIWKPSLDSHFAFLHFFLLDMFLIPVSCRMSWTSVHSSSGTVSVRYSPLNLFLPSIV